MKFLMTLAVIFCLLGCEPQPGPAIPPSTPVTTDVGAFDINKAHEHALAGHAVKLTVFDVSTPNFESFTVVLFDGNIGFEVATCVFFPTKPATFVVSLSHVLKESTHEFSQNTRIALLTRSGAKVSYSKMVVELK